MSGTMRCTMQLEGSAAYRLSLPWEKEVPAKEAVKITGKFREAVLYKEYERRGRELPGEVKEVSLREGILTIETVPFIVKTGFILDIAGEEFGPEFFTDRSTDGMELFRGYKDGDVLYQLYTPEDGEKRPLILFLHGGGGGGPKDERDNRKHMEGFGPVQLAQFYPEVYVMAPQAIETFFPWQNGGHAASTRKQTFATSSGNPDSGWSRRYLGKVCQVIRKMIAEGKVDPDRVYVTGLSMGGGGTIKAMSVGSDLFAAAAPVCPTMFPETFDILRTTKMPVWVSSAYVDHTVYRHKYLVDAIMQLKDEGHPNAHLTLYSPEELEKYDIAIEEGLSYTELFSKNHASWVLTYSNEHGIMTWLLNQHKN